MRSEASAEEKTPPVWVAVGLSTAQLRSWPRVDPLCRCPAYLGVEPLTFTPTQCALLGAGGAVVVLQVSWAAYKT